MVQWGHNSLVNRYEHMALNIPVHFEIHADNPERAAKFYAAVFGWTITKWDNPAMEYWLVTTGKAESGDKWPGIDGGLLRRMGPAPKGGEPVNAFVCTITVSSLDETWKKIQDAGGSEALPKMPIPGMGWLMYCKDTDGNIFGLMEEDTNAH